MATDFFQTCLETRVKSRENSKKKKDLVLELLSKLMQLKGNLTQHCPFPGLPPGNILPVKSHVIAPTTYKDFVLDNLSR